MSLGAITALTILSMIPSRAGAANDPTISESDKAVILLSSYGNGCGQIGYRVASVPEIMSAFMAALQTLAASGLDQEQSYAYAQQVLTDDGETLDREIRSAMEALAPERRDLLWPAVFADLIDRRCASIASHAELAPLIAAEPQDRREKARRTFESAVARQPHPAF